MLCGYLLEAAAKPKRGPPPRNGNKGRGLGGRYQEADSSRFRALLAASLT